MTFLYTTNLGVVATKIDYGYTSKSSSDGLGPFYVRITDIQGGRIDWKTVPRSVDIPDEIGKFNLKAGDILFARTGATVGKSFLITQDRHDAVFASYLIRVRLNPDLIDPRFAHAFFQSDAYWTQIREGASGTAQPNFNGAKLRDLTVPLPPLAEQRRIVARIEAVFARTRRARADLERVAPLTRQYREAATERAFTRGAAIDWPKMPLSELADIGSGITLGKKHSADANLIGRPYLRVANVQRGHLRLDDIKTVQLLARDAEKMTLLPGDVLMNEGGDRDKLGRGWVWEGQIENCVHQNHVFRVRLRGSRITPYFLSRYANQFGATYFFDEGQQTTNLASISMKKVAALPIPVPPNGKASDIDLLLQKVEDRAQAITVQASWAITLLDNLERSILARAFRGELAPQDPNDEPASVALASVDQKASTMPRRGRPGRAA